MTLKKQRCERAGIEGLDIVDTPGWVEEDVGDLTVPCALFFSSPRFLPGDTYWRCWLGQTIDTLDGGFTAGKREAVARAYLGACLLYIAAHRRFASSKARSGCILPCSFFKCVFAYRYIVRRRDPKMRILAVAYPDPDPDPGAAAASQPTSATSPPYLVEKISLRLPHPIVLH